MKQWTLVLALLALTGSVAQAQSVVFQISGRAAVRDYFGGGGTIDNLISAVVGTDLSRSESAVNGAGSSFTNITASGNTATFSVETLVATGFGADFNLFLFDSISEAFVDAYVLGAPGTPYDITVTGTGNLQITDAGFGSNILEAGTLGVTDPGFAFTWGFPGGTYSTSNFTDSNTLIYGGQTYSRVRPMARTNARSFFGISGTPGFSGFGSYHATQSVTMTVNNLGVASSAPEPASLVLMFLGSSALLHRATTRRKKKVS